MPSKPESKLSLAKAHRASDQCACFSLRKASRLLTQIYNDELRPCGLRATQFTMLVALRRNEPVSVRDLADLLVMDRTTLTRNLKPLERAGLVQGNPGSDRRVRELRLSAQGHVALTEAYPFWKKAQETVEKRLGEAQLPALVAHLGDTIATLQGD